MNGPDIFLSYNREDSAIARLFADSLIAEGFDVWWDQSLRSGETYDEVTESALRDARAVIVLWSPRSTLSRWVRSEATIADRQKKLLPATIEPCERPIMFELTQTAELSTWRGERDSPAWKALVADARRLVGTAQPSETVAAVPAQESRKPAKHAVLVVPFVNMSGESEQEYFTDGITEDIITDLSRIGSIAVVSRNRAFTYKGKTIGADTAANALGVDFMLEGSVRKVSNRVRITAQLLDTRTDSAVWSERFDRTLDDVFAIQDDIAKAVVTAMRLSLAPAESQAIERRATNNPHAYDLYQMARQFDRSGGERLKPAVIRICRKVVELDPDFAEAWALMAFAESEISQRGIEGFSHGNALEAAQRAVAVDPNCSDAHAAVGECLVRGPDLDWENGRSSIERALALDPNCYEACLSGGYGCIAQRDYAASISYFERALQIDPRGIRAAGMVVQAYKGARDREGMLTAARRATNLMEEILAKEPDHGTALGFFVGSLSALGEADRARDWAQRAALLDPDNTRMLYNIACGLIELGDHETAIDLIELILSTVSTTWILWIERDNDMDPLRDNPRFRDVLRRAKEKQPH